MSNSTKFRGLMFGVSVLPALLVMPALAVTEETVQVTEDMNINEIVPDGIIHVTSGHAINSISGYTGTLTTENISLITTAEGPRRAIQAAYAGSGVVLGNENTNSIHIESENDIAVLALDNSEVQLTAKDIDISAHSYGLTAQSGATLVVDGFDFLRVESSADSAILALAGGAKLNITGKDVEIISDSVGSSAVHAGNNTTNVENSDDLATVNIVADNVTIQGNSGGISAMSQGIVNVSGNLKMQAEDAIVARGGAKVNINTDGAHTTQMDGNIAFDYFNKPEDPGNSGTAVDATVNVTLNGANSYWNGNTIVSYEYNENGKPGEDTLDVTGMSLTLKNGATWNASKIEDVENVDKGVTSGSYYVALNNLNINNGTVNILDTENGITVNNATVADATFAGGPLNFTNGFNITGGENLFDGDVNGTGKLYITGGTTDMTGANITVNSENDDGIRVTEATLNLGGEKTDTVNISYNGTEKKVALYSVDGGDVTVTAKELNVNSQYRGITAWGTKSGQSMSIPAKMKLDVDDLNIAITTADGKETASAALLAAEFGQIDVNAKDVNLHSTGVLETAVVHVQNGTTNAQDQDTIARIDINADNIHIASDVDDALAVMSQGILNINGNAFLKGENVLVTRGDAITNINVDGTHTTRMEGNVNFDYNAPTSGTKINADVNVTLAGADSYWTGNTIASYTGTPDDESFMQVDSMTLNIQDGAKWNATAIVDNKGKDSGSYYVALNNLNINNGVVNIQDTERGITVDNATVADATFNGGPLNIGTKLDITGGENLFAGDILGDGALNVASGAVMNIGDAIVNLSSITLDGTMIANLTEGSDTAKITADTFTGDGNLSLILDKAGEYNIFGNATFDIDSVLYGIELAEDGKTFTATEKSVAQVAADSNLTVDAAQSVVNLTKSSSDALNDLGVRAQEALAVNDSAAVEHATRAINPETASVAQSVTTSVQNTVANLVAGRMASIAPVGMTGRAGGDTSLTAGGVWAQGLFNKSKSNDLFDGETMGVAAGIDGTIGRDFSIGAGYSFAASDIDASARNTDIDSHTVFVYGQYKPSQWYANAMLNYTMSSYTESGDALGVLIDSEYDIDSFGGQIATGYDFASGITPQIAVRYLHIGGADYTNSLGVASEIADSDYLTGVLGAKYAFDYNPSESVRIRPEVRAAVKYDFLSDNAVSTVTMPGVNAYVISGERLNRLGGEFGLGVTMTYAGVDVSLNYDIEVREDYTSQTGMVRARYNF